MPGYEPKVSAYVVAAICGCWNRESGVNPGIWESLIPCAWDYQYEYTNKGGFGLGQWTNVGSPYSRLWQLHNWVNDNGYKDGDGDGQIAFMIHEDIWYNSPQQRGSYTTLKEFLASDSTNTDDLVWDFLASWEGVPGDAYSERTAAARIFLEYISEHASDQKDRWKWISKNDYMSTDDTLNNVMVIYNTLNGYNPPPVSGKQKKNKMIFYLKKRMII